MDIKKAILIADFLIWLKQQPSGCPKNPLIYPATTITNCQVNYLETIYDYRENFHFNQTEFPGKPELGCADFIREFKTLSLNFGRATGKTHVARFLARNTPYTAHFKRGDSWAKINSYIAGWYLSDDMNKLISLFEHSVQKHHRPEEHIFNNPITIILDDRDIGEIRNFSKIGWVIKF